MHIELNVDPKGLSIGAFAMEVVERVLTDVIGLDKLVDENGSMQVETRADLAASIAYFLADDDTPVFQQARQIRSDSEIEGQRQDTEPIWHHGQRNKYSETPCLCNQPAKVPKGTTLTEAERDDQMMRADVLQMLVAERRAENKRQEEHQSKHRERPAIINQQVEVPEGSPLTEADREHIEYVESEWKVQIDQIKAQIKSGLESQMERAQMIQNLQLSQQQNESMSRTSFQTGHKSTRPLHPRFDADTAMNLPESFPEQHRQEYEALPQFNHVRSPPAEPLLDYPSAYSVNPSPTQSEQGERTYGDRIPSSHEHVKWGWEPSKRSNSVHSNKTEWWPELRRPSPPGYPQAYDGAELSNCPNLYVLDQTAHPPRPPSPTKELADLLKETDYQTPSTVAASMTVAGSDYENDDRTSSSMPSLVSDYEDETDTETEVEEDGEEEEEEEEEEVVEEDHDSDSADSSTPGMEPFGGNLPNPDIKRWGYPAHLLNDPDLSVEGDDKQEEQHEDETDPSRAETSDAHWKRITEDAVRAGTVHERGPALNADDFILSDPIVTTGWGRVIRPCLHPDCRGKCGWADFIDQYRLPSENVACAEPASAGVTDDGAAAAATNKGAATSEKLCPYCSCQGCAGECLRKDSAGHYTLPSRTITYAEPALFEAVENPATAAAASTTAADTSAAATDEDNNLSSWCHHGDCSSRRFHRLKMLAEHSAEIDKIPYLKLFPSPYFARSGTNDKTTTEAVAALRARVAARRKEDSLPEPLPVPSPARGEATTDATTATDTALKVFQFVPPPSDSPASSMTLSHLRAECIANGMGDDGFYGEIYDEQEDEEKPEETVPTQTAIEEQKGTEGLEGEEDFAVLEKAESVWSMPDSMPSSDSESDLWT